MSGVFLAGVHGVGKGFLGAPVAKSLGIRHFTASQLIREEKGHATWGADKLAGDIDDNQTALIRAVRRHCEAGQDILLDGHFVLRDSAGRLTKLAREVFADLQLSGVVLLTEDPKIIADRLTKRDGAVTSLVSIAELAEAESSHAHEVCEVLKIPFICLGKPTVETLTDVVSRLLKK